MTWVVLDHSKIYEYGGIDTNQYDCQAVIDLRFASVRGGRDTDRRFGMSPPSPLEVACVKLMRSVFEVISAKSGRRLYQATSEVDLKVCHSHHCPICDLSANALLPLPPKQLGEDMIYCSPCRCGYMRSRTLSSHVSTVLPPSGHSTIPNSVLRQEHSTTTPYQPVDIDL